MTATDLAALVAELRAKASWAERGTFTCTNGEILRLLAALESEYARGLNDAADICQPITLLAGNLAFYPRYMRLLATKAGG